MPANPTSGETDRVPIKNSCGTVRAVPAKQKEKAAAMVVPPALSKTAVSSPAPTISSAAPVYQGVFCRDLAVVGTLLSRGGFERSLPAKCEAMSC
jgi:hypothetical protein